MNIQIENTVVLTLGEQKITLSNEEARELYEALKTLFKPEMNLRKYIEDNLPPLKTNPRNPWDIKPTFPPQPIMCQNDSQEHW